MKPIRLRDGSWVGAKCVVGPGVELGECAVAAAGSVVTKSIPEYEIHAGNPARFVRRRLFHDSSPRYARVPNRFRPYTSVTVRHVLGTRIRNY